MGSKNSENSDVLQSLPFSQLNTRFFWQAVSQPEGFPEAHIEAARLRNEYVVCLKGRIRLRKVEHRDTATFPSCHFFKLSSNERGQRNLSHHERAILLILVPLTCGSYSAQDPNANIPSGKVEIVAEAVTMLNAVSGGLPLNVSVAPNTEEPKEETRLKNRVLDLRYDFSIAFGHPFGAPVQQLHICPGRRMHHHTASNGCNDPGCCAALFRICFVTLQSSNDGTKPSPTPQACPGH